MEMRTTKSANVVLHSLYGENSSPPQKQSDVYTYVECHIKPRNYCVWYKKILSCQDCLRKCASPIGESKVWGGKRLSNN